MIEKSVDVKTPDGVCDSYFFAPGDDGKWPAVIIYSDIGGTRESYKDMARDFVVQGFCVLVPNVYYRGGRNPVFEGQYKFGDETYRARALELGKGNTPDAVSRDAVAQAQFLLAQKQVKGPGVCVVGFCMTGAWAIRAAAAAPDLFAAAASFHGGRLATDAPDSPHLLLPKVKARLLFGFAVEDGSMPVEAIARLETALKEAGTRYEAETYEGAKHGWMMKDHAAYHPAQRERGWQKLLSTFKAATA